MEGGISGALRKYCTYTTVKVVRITHAKLAVFHHLVLLFIIAFFVFYIIEEKSYLEYEDVTGNTALVIYPPDRDYAADLNTAPYCLGSSQELDNAKQCYILDEFEISPILDLSNGFFVTSRGTTDLQIRNCSTWDHEYLACNAPWETISSFDYYSVSPEQFVIEIVHAAFAPTFDREAHPSNRHWYSGEGITMAGHIEGPNGYVDLPGESADRLPLDVALESVLNTEIIGLSDPCNEGHCGANDTFRDAGMSIFIVIEYVNTHNYFAPSTMEYRMDVSRANDVGAEFILRQSVDNDPNRRVLHRYVGIRVDFVQVSNVGRFSLSTLLLNLVAGLGLASMATIMADIIALRCAKHRSRFRAAKIQVLRLSKLKEEEEEKKRQQGTEMTKMNKGTAGPSQRRSSKLPEIEVLEFSDSESGKDELDMSQIQVDQVDTLPE